MIHKIAYRRAVYYVDRHRNQIMLLLMASLLIALIFAVLGWNRATDAQERVTTVEAEQAAERLGKNVADVTTCFNQAKNRPRLTVILRTIAGTASNEADLAIINAVIDEYAQDTPAIPDCVSLAQKLGIDPRPYQQNPPSEAGQQEGR